MAAKDPMIVGIGRSSRRRRVRSCKSRAGSSARPMNRSRSAQAEIVDLLGSEWKVPDFRVQC